MISYYIYMVTDCQVSDSGVLLSTRHDTNYQQHFSDTLAFPGGTSHRPSKMALAEGDGKGGRCELGLLLNFASDQTRLCVLDLPVVLSTRVPNESKYLQRRMLNLLVVDRHNHKLTVFYLKSFDMASV